MTSANDLRKAFFTGSLVFTALAPAHDVKAADAFGIRIQSAYFAGMSNAGAAAGGDISSMYWNSAATAVAPGLNTSSNIAAQWVSLDQNATGGILTNPALGNARSTDSGTDAVAASSYGTYQLSERIYVGLAVNAPFGLITKPDRFWAGSPFATTSRDVTFDFNPTIAYKITPQVTVGVGFQALYDEQRLGQGGGIPLGPTGPFTGSNAFRGTDWGFGGTAGILWQPWEGTTFGVGYRSAIGVDLTGSFRGFSPNFPASIVNPIYTRAHSSETLPDEVTGSFRQVLSPTITVLGTVQWDNWSRLGNVSISSPLGVLNVENLNYRDGWGFSLGVEYLYSPTLILRAGIGYDVSPITDRVRDIVVPDTDDIVLSVGSSWKYSDRISIDLAYTHAFFDSAPWCIGSPAGTNTTHCVGGAQTVLVQGHTDDTADVFSLGLRYHVGETQRLETYK